MKQTTKVLLPLGLFMSVVIPITVKSLFMETDFFEADNSSKIDYLQPYKVKPEGLVDMPKSILGEDGLSIESNAPVQNNSAKKESKSDYKNIRETKSISISDISSVEELELKSEITKAISSGIYK